MLGPGTDVTGQGHRVPPGIHRDVAVVWDQRPPVQRVLHQDVHVPGVGVVADLDVIPDVADTGQRGDRELGGGALRAVFHGAGQRQVAVTGRRLDAGRYRDGQRQRVVRRGGQHRVVTGVTGRQLDFQVVVHVLHPVDALRGSARFEVLRVAGHGAVERHIPVYVPDGDACGVDEGIEVEFCLDRLADVPGLAHVRGPFHDRCDGRPAALPVSATGLRPSGKGDSGSRDIGPGYGTAPPVSRHPAWQAPAEAYSAGQ